MVVAWSVYGQAISCSVGKFCCWSGSLSLGWSDYRLVALSGYRLFGGSVGYSVGLAKVGLSEIFFRAVLGDPEIGASHHVRMPPRASIAFSSARLSEKRI